MWSFIIATCISASGLCSCNDQAAKNTTGNEKDTLATSTGKQDEATQPQPDKFASWQPPVYDSTKKYIYLTFDDGPQPPGTTNCVDICKALNAKATFFMVGQHASNDHLKAMVASVKEDYPTLLLANHSDSHASNRYRYFYEHPEMANKDFLLAQDKLKVPFKIIRLPGNSAWVRKDEVKASKLVTPVCELLDSCGYNVIGWDVEWNFNRTTAGPVESAETMVQLVKNALNRNETHVKNHVVILTHDRMFRNPDTADSLRRFVKELKNNPDYVFETLDNYPGLKMP